MSETGRRNPYPVVDAFDRVTGWKFFDETGCECEKTYSSQEKALHAMLSYIHWLNHGPTLWQRTWWPIRYTLWPMIVQFWRDQGHAVNQPRVKVNQNGATAKGDIVGRDKIEL